MHVRIWTICLALFGLGLLAVAAWQYFGPTDGPGLAVDQPEREISDCSVGQTKVITFLLQNRARHSVLIVGPNPVQIIGLAPC